MIVLKYRYTFGLLCMFVPDTGTCCGAGARLCGLADTEGGIGWGKVTEVFGLRGYQW